MKLANIFKKNQIKYLIALLIFFNNLTLLSAGEIGGGVGFMYGAKLANINDLNDQLVEDGFQEFDPILQSIGGLGYINYNKFILSPEFASFSKKLASGNTDISYKGSQIFVNLGYAVVEEERALGFVYIGAGRGSASLKFTDPSGFVNFADEEITSAEELNTDTFLINLGYSYHFLMNFSKNQNRKAGTTVGIRVGYIFSPGAKKWEYSGAEIAGAPDAKFNGVFIRLVIGGWINKISE